MTAKNRSTQGHACHSVTSSTTNVTLIGLRSNPCFHRDNTPSNRPTIARLGGGGGGGRDCPGHPVFRVSESFFVDIC
jgi:hypothetical protein